MTEDQLEQIAEAGDRLLLHAGEAFQRSGFIEPAEEGSRLYYLTASQVSPFGVKLVGGIGLFLRAESPQDAIRRWMESQIFPGVVHEVNAYESSRAYRKGDNPLATVRGQ